MNMVSYVDKFFGVQCIRYANSCVKINYYIDTDEIPEFFLLLKNYIFFMRSEDAIFIFHV